MRRFWHGEIVSVAVVLAAAPLAQPASAQPAELLQIDDYDALADVAEPSVSPDGSRVAFVVSRVDRKANVRRNELAVISSRGGRPEVVARGGIEAPAWSPDGEELAWIGRDDAGVGVLYLAARDKLGHIRKLDAAAPDADVQRFAWSKDGRSIAVLAKPRKQAADHDKSFTIRDADYLGTSYLARSDGGRPGRLWIVSPVSGVGRSLDSVSGFPQDLAWRADGKAVFVQTQPGASVAGTRAASLLSVPVDGGKAEVLIAAPAPIGTGSRLGVSAMGALAFQHFRGPDPWTEANNVAIYRDGRVSIVTEALDRQIDDFEWLPGTAGLIVQATDHNRSRFWQVSEKGAITPVDLGDLNPIGGLSVGADGSVAFVASSASTPPEIYYLASVRALPVRLTGFGEALKGRRLGRVATIGWTQGGFAHDGVVTYPPDWDGRGSYPLLVDIHGGPEMSATDAFDFSPQFYAARGWVVFQPNYRGSSGQGNAYQSVIVKDLLQGSGDDILAGIDKVVRTLPIDAKRIAVTGWSWGGVMTSWLIGHDRRWCAAIPGAMAVDFTAYYDQSETAIWIRTMLGSPYAGDNIARYRKASPLSYLQNAVTPTLIIHNVGDPNAPVTQSLTLYHALKDRGVDTRLLLRGIDGHGYGDPFSHRQVHAATLQWLTQKCPASRRP